MAPDERVELARQYHTRLRELSPHDREGVKLLLDTYRAALKRLFSDKEAGDEKK